MDKITIKQAIQRLNTSRSTLYKYLKQCEIKVTKEKNKSFLTIQQLEKIRKAIKDSKPEKTQNTENIEVSETVKTLKKELEDEKKRNKALEIKQGKFKFENDKLKVENIKLETKAEVLETQNHKMMFQMGAVAEKMQTLETEKMKLIEVLEEPKKSGIFKRVFQFWK
jgi:hypothetical protein